MQLAERLGERQKAGRCQRILASEQVGERNARVEILKHQQPGSVIAADEPRREIDTQPGQELQTGSLGRDLRQLCTDPRGVIAQPLHDHRLRQPVARTPRQMSALDRPRSQVLPPLDRDRNAEGDREQPLNRGLSGPPALHRSSLPFAAPRGTRPHNRVLSLRRERLSDAPRKSGRPLLLLFDETGSEALVVAPASMQQSRPRRTYCPRGLWTVERANLSCFSVNRHPRVLRCFCAVRLSGSARTAALIRW